MEYGCSDTKLGLLNWRNGKRMKTNIALLIEQAANVTDSLNSGIRLTKEEQIFICEHFICEEIKKNDFTIQIGDHENYVYFIEKGILRSWTICSPSEPKEQITFWFTFPGEFACSYFSLKNDKPSYINIQALTNCTIWKLSKQDLSYLYDTSLNFNKIAKVFFEDILIRQVNREIQLLGLSCDNLYKELIDRQKELIKQIPLKYIASYIGITPQTLSQVRRKIILNK